MGNLEGHVGILLNHHQGCLLLLVDSSMIWKYLFDQKRAQAQRGLIQQEKLGMGHEALSDDQHLEFTAAAVACHGLLPGQQGGKIIVNHFQIFLIGFSPAGGRADPQIFFNGQVFELLPSFQDLDDPFRVISSGDEF